METLTENCKSFLEKLTYNFSKEFVDRYCHGRLTYDDYAREDPESFARDVLSFSLTHRDSWYFQHWAIFFIGREADRRKLLDEIPEKDDVSDGLNHGEPKKSSGSVLENRNKATRTADVNRKKPTVTFSSFEDDPDVIWNDELEKKHGSQQERGTHGQLYLPDKPHTETELKDSIKYKLFRKPLSHDRYTRLTKEEIRFIRKNAGLSGKERAVFLEKCESEYFPYKMIAVHLGCSESKIKQIAVRIDKMIRQMINQK